MAKKEIINFFKTIYENKKIYYSIIFLLLLFVIISSSIIRSSNISLLIDKTTGKHIPLALDPFYFLRMSETIVQTKGNLPAYDSLRSPQLHISWHKEILSWVIAWIWKGCSLFNSSITLEYIDVIYPVIFYVLGILAFFFLVWFLTKSEIVALISSSFLAYSPAYLYRTMAGFADHEAIGIFSVFIVFLVFTLALKNNNFEKSFKHTIIYSLLLGFSTAFVLASWGGALTFVLMIVPFAFFLFYFINSKDKQKEILFFSIWIFSSLFFSVFPFGFSFLDFFGRMTGSYGLLVPFTLIFMIIDYSLELIKTKYERINYDFRKLYSLIITFILGFFGLFLIGRNPFSILQDIWFRLLYPFGIGRLGITVAENAQPYLRDLIGQFGQNTFWLFVIGLICLIVVFSKKLKKDERIYLFLSWTYLVASILFSRISSNSQILNGESFISQMFYLSGLVLFFGYFLWLFMKNNRLVENESIILLSIGFFVLINGRSAVRTFFLIAPFITLFAGYSIVKLFEFASKNKDEFFRAMLFIAFAIALFSAGIEIYHQYEVVSNNAKLTGPSADLQWQYAMKWVRENTPENSIFVHWWDYGYWIQTLGERPTVTDGGHSGGIGADHRIGRYVLTTPNPKTAYSYMKTWNVSYLLIDSTDLGKYGAYSRIGSNDSWDRISMIPVGVIDDRQTRETSNETIFVYSITGAVDDDIIYKEGGKTLFLPGLSFDKYGRPQGRSALVGVILKVHNVDDKTKIEQPIGVYVYNNQQYRIPLRYVYYNKEIIDFKKGLDAVFMIIPEFLQSSKGISINPIGGAIYLSPKVSKSLFARLYLMDNAFRDYNEITLVHSEDHSFVKSLKQMGLTNSDFVYNPYAPTHFIGPIKIWKVDYPKDTLVYEQFLSREVEEGFGGMDKYF